MTVQLDAPVPAGASCRAQERGNGGAASWNIAVAGLSSCWAQETDNGGAAITAIDYDSADRAVAVTAGTPNITITATNTFAAATGTGFGLGTWPLAPAAIILGGLLVLVARRVR